MAGTRSALIVATDTYDDQRLARLQAPEADAEALAGVLSDPEIGGFDVTTVLNRPWHEVARAVALFFRNRRPEDLVLVHFSCHGLKDDSGELYFAATDTSLDLLEATAVSSASVNRVMDRSRAGSVLLLLDCCYAGAFARGMTARAGGGVDVNERLGGRGRAVITASSALQFAFEGDTIADGDPESVRPSLFTTALVEGLRTGEADRDLDGWVSLDELYSYIHDEVTRVNPDQTPTKWAFDIEGDVRIARRGTPVSTPAELPSPIVDSTKSLFSWERVAVVEPLSELLEGGHPGRALAARLALEEMAAHDDSDRVKSVARAALENTAPATRIAPSPTPPPSAPPRVILDPEPSSGPAPSNTRKPTIQPGPKPPAEVAPPMSSTRPGRWLRMLSRRTWIVISTVAVVVTGGVTWVIVAALNGGSAHPSSGGSAYLSQSELVTSQTNGGPRQLVRFERAGSGNTVDIVDEPDAVGPAISPDRTQVAYLRVASGHHSGMAFLVDANGEQDHRLLSNTAVSDCPRMGRPAFSPGGESIALVCLGRNGTTHLGVWVSDLLGNIHQVLNWKSAGADPSWGNDDKIYFVSLGSSGKPDHIYAVPASGGASPEQVTYDPGFASDPDWGSPGLLYLESDRRNQPGDIYLRTKRGSTELTTTGDVSFPVWSPDYTHVAWLAPSANDPGHLVIWAATFTTTASGGPSLGAATELPMSGSPGPLAWGTR